MTAAADYYLGSNELTVWAPPRAVSVVAGTPDGVRVTLDPPAADGTRDFVLRPRYEGESIGGSRPPIVVNIFDPEGRHVGVGELYRTRGEAARTSGGLT